MIKEILAFPGRLTLAAFDVVSIGLEIFHGRKRNRAYWDGYNDGLDQAGNVRQPDSRGPE